MGDDDTVATASDGWSDVAGAWADAWEAFPAPVHERLLHVARVEADTSALDVGCGSGELLATLIARGVSAAGVDPAAGMLARARSAAPAAEVRSGSWAALPWPDASFEVVFAVNALQFADDTLAALAEARRVLAPGGRVAVANWADRALNDLDTVERALEADAGYETEPDGDLRVPGGLEALLEDAGFRLVEAGMVDVPWRPDGEAELVRGILLDDEADPESVDVVLVASQQFRRDDGGYEFANTFRYVVGVLPEVPVAATPESPPAVADPTGDRS